MWPKLILGVASIGLDDGLEVAGHGSGQLSLHVQGDVLDQDPLDLLL